MALTSLGLMAPVPTSIGILPLTSWTATSRTDLRSSIVRRDASPVVPRIQMPSVWDSMWSWSRRRREGKSILPVGVMGVIRATVLPALIGLISFTFDPMERALFPIVVDDEISFEVLL